ncbi:TPA: amidohydrolase family protein [Streptococcus suis]
MCNCKAIDTHAHLWSEEYLTGLEALGATGVSIAAGMGAGVTEDELSKRFDMMEAAGVSYQVLSATPQIPQFGNQEQALSLAQQINDEYAGLIKKYPDKFKAYGAVPLPHVDQAIKEGRRVISDLGFLGIALNTVFEDGTPITDKRFEPFFEAMNELGTIIYIHPTGCGAFSPMVNDHDLEWVVGAPIEDMLATLQLLKHEYPQKFPNIKFHVAHLGGGISFQMTRIMDNYRDWDAFKHSPIESIKKSFWFDAANFQSESLEQAVKVFGSDRILMGSDFPYFQDQQYVRATQYIKEANLSDQEKIALLSLNAKALYQAD